MENEGVCVPIYMWTFFFNSREHTEEESGVSEPLVLGRFWEGGGTYFRVKVLRMEILYSPHWAPEPFQNRYQVSLLPFYRVSSIHGAIYARPVKNEENIT